MIKEPIFENLPSKEDFYYDGDCDERYAIANYYGKDIDFMLGECKSSIPLAIMDTFYFVGTKAFRYYVFAVFRYLQEAVESGNEEMLFESSSTLSFLVQMLNQHLDESPQDMQCISAYVKEFSIWVIENYDAFDVSEKVFGNMQEKWKELIKKVEKLYGI